MELLGNMVFNGWMFYGMEGLRMRRPVMWSVIVGD